MASVAFRANPRTMELLLRTPEDIHVLEVSSRWTVQRLGMAALFLLFLMLGALAWVAVLRRRVREQTHVIRRKIEREAVLEERQRMAREMHDTLAQSFSGVGFQLEALDARLPEDAALRQTLSTAKNLVRHGQEEFRRSLLNLRASEFERGGLAAALAEVGRFATAGTGIEFGFTQNGALSRLPEGVENNLLRIGQECLTNAVRHSGARRVWVELSGEGHCTQLRVCDDGCGFEPEELVRSESVRFGWRGIRERAEQIGATVCVDAAPGRGTAVIVSVSVAAACG